MPAELWAEVDDYICGTLVPRDDALEAALAASEASGLPEIQVSPPQGKLLAILAQSIGARTVLEFGTLGGYSTIWLARVLPADGLLITLEADQAYAEVARKNIAEASLADIVNLRVGPALDSLPALADEGAGPFDLTFIDADKENTPAYFSWALDRTRPGGLIIADNVIRDGALADAACDDPKIQAQRHLHELIAEDPRVTATTIQTVGGKGYDGFTVALVEDVAT